MIELQSCNPDSIYLEKKNINERKRCPKEVSQICKILRGVLNERKNTSKTIQNPWAAQAAARAEQKARVA